jgi:hypothetical protein
MFWYGVIAGVVLTIVTGVFFIFMDHADKD